MKITIIEANKEELKASNTLADGLSIMLRKVFCPIDSQDDEEAAEE